MKPWKEVIDGIRNAVLGKEVREDIAQMGEYCKQYAEEAGTRADSAKDAAASSASAAASSATQAGQSAKIAADTASSTLSALGLTVVDGKICAVYRRSGT